MAEQQSTGGKKAHNEEVGEEHDAFDYRAALAAEGGELAHAVLARRLASQQQGGAAPPAVAAAAWLRQGRGGRGGAPPPPPPRPGRLDDEPVTAPTPAAQAAAEAEAALKDNPILTAFGAGEPLKLSYLAVGALAALLYSYSLNAVVLGPWVPVVNAAATAAFVIFLYRRFNQP